MRTLGMAVVAVVLAGCGEKGLKAWDKNHDGLIAQCEGLNRIACDLTPECQGQELACLAICLDDGKGGCLPCDSFACIPKQASCESLDLTQCTNDPRCELKPSKPGVCPPNAFCDLSLPAPTCGPKSSPEPQCSLLPVGVCGLVPACQVQDITVCSVTHSAETDEAKHGNDSSADCGVAPGGCTTTQICTQRTPATCESLDPTVCSANPSCELQTGPVCEIACLQGMDCPPCATPKQLCVTKPNHCESRSVDQCATEAGCMVENFACLAICEDDGNGGCLPCDAPPAKCVAIPAPIGEPEQSTPPPTK